jgi:HEAT repeat protein
MFDLFKVWGLSWKLRARDWKVREKAVKALGKTGSSRALKPLSGALADNDSRVRRAAAEALGSLGNSHAIEPLRRALADEDRDVRNAAVEALGGISDSRVVELLFGSLVDNDSRVRKTTAGVLCKLGDPVWQEVCRGDHFYEEFSRLGSISDKRAVELLIMALGSHDDRIRPATADLLDKNGEPTWKRLIRRDDDDFERLGSCGDKRAVMPLIKALESHSGWLERLRVIRALANLGDVRAIAPLNRCLKDREKLVREEAAKALGKLGGRRADAGNHSSERRPRLKPGIGTDCPFYSDGSCVSRGQSTGRCTLERGSYRTSCHVYPILQSRS